MAPQALADVQAVGVGEHDIQHDQVGTFAHAQLDGAFAGIRPDHLKAFPLEVVFQQRVKIDIIFDQQNFFHLKPVPILNISRVNEFSITDNEIQLTRDT